MKRICFIFLLPFFVVIGFAQMPEIVNPPRPTVKFKWLTVVKHDNDNGKHTHYIYTDAYHVERHNSGETYTLELVSDSDWQECSDFGRGCNYLDRGGPGDITAMLYDKNLGLLSSDFLVVKAPTPRLKLRALDKEARIEKNTTGKKAKIVFKP